MFVRACKEWGIPTVAVHSDVDRESMHVRMADESVCIGSHQPANSYLNIPHLMSAIELTNADAVHPGYGFLSENASFAKILEENKIRFIDNKDIDIEETDLLLLDTLHRYDQLKGELDRHSDTCDQVCLGQSDMGWIKVL